jgi:hypothetical protein
MAVHIGNHTDIGGMKIPEGIPRREKRRVVQSHLTLAQIRYGLPPISWSNLADRGDVFTVSLRLTDETSAVRFDGKMYRMSSKVGDVRILYLASRCSVWSDSCKDSRAAHCRAARSPGDGTWGTVGQLDSCEERKPPPRSVGSPGR